MQNILEDVKAMKIMFTTERTRDESSGSLIDQKQFNVRTVFFGASNVHEEFRGVSLSEIRHEFEWSPTKLDGIWRHVLEQYTASMNVEEHLINAGSKFTGANQFITNDLTVVKLVK